MLRRWAWVVTLVLMGLGSASRALAAATRADLNWPFRVDEVVISGNQKLESAAVRAKIEAQPGQSVDRATITRDVRNLFATGFFDDVRVDVARRDGKGILTVFIVEKPIIEAIVFEGNSEINDEDLFATAALKAFEFVDVNRIREAVSKIEKDYEEKGFFLARVRWRLDPLADPKRVKLVFDIRENDKVIVKRINFIGNRHFSQSKLKGVMETSEGGFFTGIFGGGNFRQENFERDLSRLNFLYWTEGYMQVKIDRPQVTVSPDKRGIFISIRIEEGQQFRVGTVDFTGDILFPHAELTEEMQVKSGDIFNYENLQKDLQALQAKYGDLGYAYANPIPRHQLRESERLIDVTYDVERGNKVYIGKISVVGNSKTRDKVVRRELKILEGELYNETRKRESIANVRRLGFFEDVNFVTKPSGLTQDIMDIEISVKERQTGSAQLGIGWASGGQGMLIQGQLEQSNLFGLGQNLAASLVYNQVENRFSISFTEPYFLDTNWSVGVDAYRTERRVKEAYEEVRAGGGFRLGHPLAPYLNGFWGYKLDKTDVTLLRDGDSDIYPESTVDGWTSATTFTLVYDKRDDRMKPTSGTYWNVGLEYAGLGGDLKYTKGGVNLRYYRKLFWEFVWRNNLSYGFITSNRVDRDPPFNQLYLLGGINSLRGFEPFTVGRRKRSQNAYDRSVAAGTPFDQAEIDALQPFGGTQQLYYNLEFQWPLVRDVQLNGVVFFDVGNAEDQLDLNALRSNVGFGIRWFSPLGPLRFEWGFPLERRPEFYEEPYQFHFTIGAPF